MMTLAEKHSKRVTGLSQGFSLVELLVVMGIFVVITAATGNVFKTILGQSMKESRSVESQISDIIGLEALRYDVEHAGYGLPWSFQNTINYSEAATTPGSDYNDAASNPPRAILSGNNTGYNGSDYLVIKSAVATRNTTSGKWTHIMQDGSRKTWTEPDKQLVPGEKVVVVNPSFSGTADRQLVMNGTNFYANYSTAITSGLHLRYFFPPELFQKFLVYGIDPGSTLSMPFNRADFSIARPSSISQRCAANTGVLYKSSLRHSDGGFTQLPLMDCVADMQVAYGLDASGGGTITLHDDVIASPLSAITPTLIRDQVKEVRIFILAHEGGKDTGFTYPSQTVSVGESFNGVFRGSTFDLAARIGAGWQNYRWKVYSIVVVPKNL